MSEKKATEATASDDAKDAARAARAEERVLEAHPDAYERRTGSALAVNRPLADHEIPPPAMATGTLRIRLHGGGYERDCTVDEWARIFAKEVGKWEIVRTGVVAPQHSAPENFA